MFVWAERQPYDERRNDTLNKKKAPHDCKALVYLVGRDRGRMLNPDGVSVAVHWAMLSGYSARTVGNISSIALAQIG